MKISRWENPGIDVYPIPGICQPASISPGIDFPGNRSLGAPVIVYPTHISKGHPVAELSDGVKYDVI